MKHAVSILVVAAFVAAPAAPAAAQWSGMPVWNSPKGGTGLTISGDYGRPDAQYGNGTAWGGRASLGLGTLTLTAGAASWKPGYVGATQSFTSFGGNATMRLIGGSLLPIAVNLQVGAARTDSANLVPAQTTVTGAVGISVPLPAPYLTIEPYFSPGVRYRHFGGTISSSTEFGYAVGANLGFGLVGVHLAYDNEKRKGAPSVGVFGIGAHLDIKLPLGM